MLTKYDFFNCVHIEDDIKKRIRHQGRIINLILLDGQPPSDFVGQAAFDRDVNHLTIDAVYWEKALKDIEKVEVCTTPHFGRKTQNREVQMIQVNSDEIYVMYEQVRAKTGKDVDDDNLGEIITLA